MLRLMHISHRGAVYWEWQLANILIVFLLHVEWYLLQQYVDTIAFWNLGLQYFKAKNMDEQKFILNVCNSMNCNSMWTSYIESILS